MSDAMTQAQDCLSRCVERFRGVQDDHIALGKAHATLASLHREMRDSISSGDPARMRAVCAATEIAMGKCAAAHRDVAAGHDALTRGLDATSLALRAAADDAAVKPYVEPTHLTGTGNSGGDLTLNGNGTTPPPRALTAEEIRRRDQAIGVELGYRAKIAALRNRH
jgi:hypothetical protein